jgi:hypothetical protein
MLDEGVDANSMSNRDWQMAREQRVKNNRAARGPMAYDQAQGRLVPSPKAQTQKQSTQAQKMQGVSAADYWQRNPESKRTAVNAQGKTVNVEDLNRAYVKSREAEAAREARRGQIVQNYRDTKRKANETAAGNRMDDFLIAQDQQKRDAAKAEAYLKNFDRQARAMRRASIGNSYTGKEGAEGFWERNAETQATAQNLRRMSKEDRLRWADSQVKKDEEAKAEQISTAARPPVVTEEGVADFFNRPFSLSEFVKIFFGGGGR